ncbi:MAG TPA: riboflavin synthase [bacterium]|nr:riboflavin synthase [bacterium]
MFTGIIREIGTIRGVKRKTGSLDLAVECPETAAISQTGDSIAVNGVCLTATSIQGKTVTMDVGEETFSRTTLSTVSAGTRVNIEPALRLGDSMGGHIVSGHVDAVGTIKSLSPQNTQWVYEISYPGELAKLIAAKGSIAVDGISLTVGKTGRNSFELYIIPHTLDETTLKNKKAGDRVNLEADVLARYVVNAIEGKKTGDEGLKKILKDTGFID